MGRYLTSRELAKQLAATVSRDRRQKAIAIDLGISDAYLSDFLNGKREAGPMILTALGYEPTPFYRKARGQS